MQAMPFDPLNLRPDASMNRVVIADPLPSPFADKVRGRTSFSLLSLNAFTDTIATQATSLRLSRAELSTRDRLPEALESRLRSDEAYVSHPAEALADERGAYLAYHIATLHRGDEASRAARPEWDETHWAYRASIRQVVLGGGTMSGELGRLVVEAARAWLETWHVGVKLTVPKQPGILPLIGAARSVPMPASSALAVDFGNTGAKAAFATYEASSLSSLRPLPTEASQPYMMPVQTREGTRRLADFVTGFIGKHWQAGRDARLSLAPTIVCSMSGYLHNGHPIDVNGSSYASLGMLVPNLGTWLSQRVSFEVGEAVSVELVHDCTCAARAYAGETATAVLMMGTSLGVGFPPASVPQAVSFEV
jgi:hypothetical protein